MKRILNTLVLVALLLPLSLIANPLEGRYTRERKVSKTFEVAEDAKLKVSNRYGNVSISPWDRNEISIEVIIRTSGNNETKVEDKLDDIQIEFDGTKSYVSAITHIESSRSWFNWFGSNVNYKINYHIKVPITNELDIKNRYGDTFIDESTAKVTLTHDYGSIIVGSLRNEYNSIDMDYSKLEADYIKKADFNVDYSNIKIDEIESVTIVSDYSDFELGKVLTVNYDADYGAIELEAVNTVQGNSDYTDISIDLLGTRADLSADYGKINIGSISNQFSSIIVDTDYTGVQLGYSEEVSFNFIINSKYTDVDGIDADGFDMRISKEKSGGSKYYEGSFGNNPSQSNLEFKTSYGHIKFRKRFNN